jgi:DNA-binding NarL/FixJ family response regulator
MQERINIYVIDDETLVRDTISRCLTIIDDLNVVGAASGADQACGEIERLKPEVIIVDVRLKDENGIDLAREIRKRCPDTKIIILSGYFNESLVASAYAVGASAFLSKSIAISHLVASVYHVMQTDRFYAPQMPEELLDQLVIENKKKVSRFSALTQRESEVLKLIAGEFSTKEISDMLGISEKTVRNHKSNIMNKLGINSQVGLIKFAYYMALI